MKIKLQLHHLTKINILELDSVELEDILQVALNLAAEPLADKAEGEIIVALSLLSAAKIQELNAQYRKVNKVTDVLSFPMFDFHEGENSSNIPRYEWYDPSRVDCNIFLGDILINPERVAEQAETYGHSLKREFVFLMVHGFLHLLGYDHLEAQEEGRMQAKQKAIMAEIGLLRD